MGQCLSCLEITARNNHHDYAKDMAVFKLFFSQQYYQLL